MELIIGFIDFIIAIWIIQISIAGLLGLLGLIGNASQQKQKQNQQYTTNTEPLYIPPPFLVEEISTPKEDDDINVLQILKGKY